MKTNQLPQIFLLVMLFISASSFAQIGINTNSPEVSSVLDINSPASGAKGLLIPRMTTVQKEAITSPAHSLLVYDSDQKCISQNLGTETIPKWTCLTLFNRKFFYMPSINIETTTLGTFNIDLYAQYKTEYGTPMYTSTGAPTEIPYFPSRESLYYYISYHDPTRITINSIDANGVMNYTTTKKANYDDYLNIVFVIK
ncbi:hypothetical protein [Dysgonomonas macrotermitis]|uniref:Uncharacterized protein n=1 Tax=Dysgonomonas macrotermitis TaxID=1346286 RepID=A0A1M4ZFB2_9BACT|nr:hypothetical protein [Dysgonomonas macrotermitis]SHF16691.1 hypothetical protein SAMN05444362_10473 [Dysgonomonas macrotermitis]